YLWLPSLKRCIARALELPHPPSTIHHPPLLPLIGLLLATAAGCALTADDVVHSAILPEQRTIDHRDPAELPPARIPLNTPPRTVSNTQLDTPEWRLSLDEALRIALENARVIRVLAGTAATTSGQTIYEAAITNTTIDQAQATFDPTLAQKSTFTHADNPTPFADPFSPARTLIFDGQVDSFQSQASLSKTNVIGGQAALTAVDTTTHLNAAGSPLNPENQNSIALSYTQPLLQGGGYAVNMAPIVIARLNTETSYFQYKDSVQEMVRGVIESYWNLVQARTDAWARKIQVQQSDEEASREEARLKSGLADLKDVAQAKVTYTQFKAQLIAADALVLTREDTLRNILGLPPNDNRRIIPVSAPTIKRLKPDWKELVHIGEQRRPDIIELKLILQADQQRLLQAQNGALPKLDAFGQYRWNGISGEMFNGDGLSTNYTDWSVGINFSVPLGMRQGRAQIRQRELTLARDQANIDQSVHEAIHQLALTVEDLDSNYEQYLAYKESRAAALDNLQVQIEQFRVHRNIYLNVLQALNDWGSAVTSESRAILSYNVSLANLERQTGTILETHGLVFVEERLRAAGPLLLPSHDRLYPASEPPTGNPQMYPSTGAPSEESFNLKNPDPYQKPPKDAPAPPAKPGADAK
ncbi:MAG TPA: TolC family protein, partial [Gemmataceae bacterium]|nr:TolC family protein [Gemmataceae bacterium]